jgi:hypothetical protein
VAPRNSVAPTTATSRDGGRRTCLHTCEKKEGWIHKRNHTHIHIKENERSSLSPLKKKNNTFAAVLIYMST